MNNNNNNLVTENLNQITLKVQTPKGVLERDFPKTAKISDVLNAVIKHFNFAANGRYELRLDDNPEELLRLERTLISYKLKNGDIMVLIDFGQAV